MSQGDVVFFDQFIYDLARGPDVGHDFGVTPDTIKLAIVDSTITPTEATADPRWGASGTTDLSANEVTVAGDYVAGGNTLANFAVSLSGGQVNFDWDDPSPWTSGTDTDARWGIIYNDTVAGKPCIGFVDLGLAFDMSTGTLTITFPSPAATLNQA